MKKKGKKRLTQARRQKPFEDLRQKATKKKIQIGSVEQRERKSF